MKKYSELKLILFFIILTGVVTAIVIFTWEKVFMLPFYDWVAAYYPGDPNARYFFEQRIEHFFISTTVDVIVVTLLLRIVSRQQRKLVSSEERYRALFEHASDGIGIVRASDHRLIEVNNKFCEILACQPKALINQNINDLIQTDGDGSRGDPPTQPLGDSAPGGGELMIRTSAGKPIPVSVSSNEISTVGEHLVILIIHDLSERKRFEAEKEEIQLQLFQSSKLASIGELSAGLAHEINNPLNGMINYAQLLKDDGVARTDSQRRILDGILDEGGRIAKIVRDLLTFARQDPHEPARTSVAETINASMSLFGHQLEKDGISIEIDAEGGLPPVMADGSRLRQVMVNMISNAHHALRAKRSGAKVFRVTARAVKKVGDGRERVRIEFYDSGTGIRREDLDKVFDPFFTTRRSNGGTGLGLSLSFGIIREYGGTITVESEEGRHTRFVVELPAAISREAGHESTKSIAGGR
jgi:PAS domain S-box-containing protein